jgi:hypothetical protein
MPTVLRVGPYRFHFYSDESREPAQDLREIERLVFEHQEFFVRRYHEHHNR